MRVIVTGGLGFIGSHLSEWLVRAGHDVVIVDDRRTAAVDDVPGTRLIVAPIAAVAPEPAHAIIHLASPVGPLGVIGWRGRLAPEVIDDAATVASWARASGAVLVDVSTSEVYGSGHQDGEADDCTFRAATSARKEYALAKLAAETMLRNLPGLDVRIVRPFNVAGPRQRAEGGFVLPRFIEQATRREPLTVYLPGSQRRAFTHVRDIVEGLVLAMTRGRAGEVYNLGNPANACAITDLASEVNAALGSDAGYALVDPRELHGPLFVEAPDKLPNPSKAMRELGWRPRRSRADCIRDALPVPA